MNATASAFRSAVESRDLDAGLALLADDVVFHSPAVHRPYVGKETVSGLLNLVLSTFENFRYTDEFHGEDGAHILVFRAEVDGKELQGLDLLRLNDAGEIADFTVMVRPASGLIALATAMGPKVEAAGLKPS